LANQAGRKHTGINDIRPPFGERKPDPKSFGEVFIALETDMPWRALRDKMKGCGDNGREKRGPAQ